MNQSLQNILKLAEESVNLSEEQKKQFAALVKEADNLITVTEFKLDRTEKVKKTTAILLEETIEELEQKRKAVEAQNKDLEIEAALERVRSRSMGMHKSDELKEVIRLVLEQLVHLKINAEHAGFYIDYKVHDDMHIWLADPNIEPFYATIPYFDTPTWNSFLEAKAKGTAFHTDLLDFEEKNRFYKSLFKLFTVPEEAKEFYLRCKGLAVSTVLLDNVGLYIENFSGIPYSDEENKILMRFGKVFQQTYTRFLDLQKAEVQAREAEIEGSLERVRSRSLAMHTTSELQEVIHTVHNELLRLNIAIHGGSFISINKDIQTTLRCWGSGGTANTTEEVRLPFYDKPFCTDLVNGIKNNRGFFTEEFTQQEKREFFTFLFEYKPWSELNDKQKNEILLSPGGYTRSCNVSPNTTIFIINHFGEKFSIADNDILQRFGKVFEQTYTRFLDLQKAEAQAREAQIEAALERVRSKAMAMHKSEDLNPAVAIVFEELHKLNIGIIRCGIGVLDKNKRSADVFSTALSDYGNTVQVTGDESMDIHPLLQGAFNAWLQGTDFSYTLEGEDLVRYYTAVGATNIQVPQSHTEAEQQYYYVSTFQAGGLFAFRNSPFPEEAKTVMKRFANVFNLTYKRFLDIQKAEAQARESQIQLALERVRARTMAMQKSDELRELVAVIYDQLQQLGFTEGASNILIMEEKSGDVDWWMSGFGTLQYPESFHVNFFNHPAHIAQLSAWKSGERFTTIEVAGKSKKEFDEVMLNRTDFKKLSDEIKTGIKSLEKVVFSMAFMRYGALVWATNAITDEHAIILQRFGKVFEQTFTRFLDLQKAEAQAREAKIEAAMEKIRASAMAMHSSADLFTVADLLHDQLSQLGNKELESSIIHLYPEHSTDIEIWYSYKNADGEFIRDHGSIAKDICLWTKEVINKYNSPENTYTIRSSGHMLEEWYTILDRVAPSTIEHDASGKIMLPEELYYHFSKFSGGALLMISGEEPGAEACNLQLRAANVFQLAYRRYKDLENAEAQAREAQIEAALERVRAVAMSMMKSDDLSAVCKAVYQQTEGLGFKDVRFAQIYVRNDEEKKFRNYDYSDATGAEVVNVKYDSHANTKHIFDVIRDTNDELVHNVIDKNQLDEWKNYLYNTLGQPHEKKLDEASELHYYLYSFGIGAFGICTFKTITEEQLDILKRFRNVFSLSYQRYIDISQAEAQAREAQIEAALERVRSRTLAMQKSDELSETAAEVFKQLISLGMEPNRLYIGIIKNDTRDIEMWATDEDGSGIGKKFVFNAGDNSSVKKLYDGWAEKLKSITVEMQGAELENYISYLRQLRLPLSHALTQKRRVQSVAYFDKGFIGMASPDEQSEDSIHLLERFAAVFNLTFTRFNDLKIAEAHALQAEQDLIEIKAARKKAEDTLTELQSTQKQLIQSEKMASLGELTAGIAHEIQNPLNFVNNFSEVNAELIEEMKQELNKGDIDEAKFIAEDIRQNLEKINHHGKRAESIVKGMLQHSQRNAGEKMFTDINALADEYLRLAYHGIRAKDKSFNAKLETDFDTQIGKVNIIPQDIGRVILNILTNAFYAVNEKKKSADKNYHPTVTVRTRKSKDVIEIVVNDNGNGIPQNIVDKIFQPFFTTKPTGQGTGLGLSLAYDIVKAHGGELKVETKEGEGSIFIIELSAN